MHRALQQVGNMGIVHGLRPYRFEVAVLLDVISFRGHRRLAIRRVFGRYVFGEFVGLGQQAWVRIHRIALRRGQSGFIYLALWRLRQRLDLWRPIFSPGLQEASRCNEHKNSERFHDPVIFREPNRHILPDLSDARNSGDSQRRRNRSVAERNCSERGALFVLGRVVHAHFGEVQGEVFGQAVIGV